MGTPESDTFQQLLEAIREMNKNLETATFAINNMTMQLNSVTATVTVNSILPPDDSSQQAPTNPEVSDTPTDGNLRTLGYINWDTSHDILKTMRLVKMSVIRQSLANFIKNLNQPAQKQTRNQNKAISYGYGDETSDDETGNFDFRNIFKPMVCKESRYPLDAVYVDVESPRVKEEMKFMNEINALPTDGAIDRFLKIVEGEMHTCVSFEKQYGLKWV